METNTTHMEFDKHKIETTNETNEIKNKNGNGNENEHATQTRKTKIGNKHEGNY